MELVTYNRA